MPPIFAKRTIKLPSIVTKRSVDGNHYDFTIHYLTSSMRCTYWLVPRFKRCKIKTHDLWQAYNGEWVVGCYHHRDTVVDKWIAEKEKALHR